MFDITVSFRPEYHSHFWSSSRPDEPRFKIWPHRRGDFFSVWPVTDTLVETVEYLGILMVRSMQLLCHREQINGVPRRLQIIHFIASYLQHELQIQCIMQDKIQQQQNVLNWNRMRMHDQIQEYTVYWLLLLHHFCAGVTDSWIKTREIQTQTRGV